MTNTIPKILLTTVLTTNWLGTTLEQPTGNGSTRQESREIGVIVSNRYATVIAEGVTNRILVSSELHLPGRMLIRELQPETVIGYGLTNRIFGGIRFASNYFRIIEPETK